MQRLGIEQFRRNAYRVLGLDADATQSEIDRAARLLRLVKEADAAAEALAEVRDVPWLGPVDRSGQAVEQAVATLADPQSRVSERIWWFCNPELAEGTAPVDPAAAKHDAALTTCCRMFLAASSARDVAQWSVVIDVFEGVAQCGDYGNWVQRAEENGAFEKLASARELSLVHAQMPGRIADIITGLGEDALAAEDFSGAGIAIAALRSHPGAAAEAAERLLNRMEDLLVATCSGWGERISQVWKLKSTELLGEVCNEAVRAYEKSVRNLMGQLSGHAAHEEFRRERAWGHAIKLLEHIADAYRACHDPRGERRALEKAMAVAMGTIAEMRIRQRLDEVTAQTQPPPAPRSGLGTTVRSRTGNRSSPRNNVKKLGNYLLISILLFMAGVAVVDLTSTRQTHDSYKSSPEDFADDSASGAHLNNSSMPSSGVESQATEAKDRSTSVDDYLHSMGFPKFPPGYTVGPETQQPFDSRIQNLPATNPEGR